MEGLVITILKQGALAFIGCKLTKALNEKEISELIAASGWAIVGTSALNTIIPLIKWVRKTAESIDKVADKIHFIN